MSCTFSSGAIVIGDKSSVMLSEDASSSFEWWYIAQNIQGHSHPRTDHHATCGVTQRTIKAMAVFDLEKDARSEPHTEPRLYFQVTIGHCRYESDFILILPSFKSDQCVFECRTGIAISSTSSYGGHRSRVTHVKGCNTGPYSCGIHGTYNYDQWAVTSGPCVFWTPPRRAQNPPGQSFADATRKGYSNHIDNRVPSLDFTAYRNGV